VIDTGEDAGLIAADLEIDLVGLELHDRLTGADRLANLFEPSADTCLDDGLS
jgi:hypothetical protein